MPSVLSIPTTEIPFHFLCFPIIQQEALLTHVLTHPHLFQALSDTATLAGEDIALVDANKLGDDRVIPEKGRLAKDNRELGVGEDMSEESFPLCDGEADEVERNFSGGYGQDRGHCDRGRRCQVEHLISLPPCGSVVIIEAVIRLLLHLLPVRGGVLYFKCNQGASLPRDAQIESIV